MTEQEIMQAAEEDQESKRRIYNAGHMLTKGSQMQRAAEASEIRALGHKLYSPAENKKINDKAALKDEPLAERIVQHDTDAIKWADTIIIEPLPEAQGTVCELGQIHGMKMMAEMIRELIEEECFEGDDTHILDKVEELVAKVMTKQVFPHYEDIRRVPGIMETEDRRSLGINQYVYGVCLDLTDGVGFYDWPSILEELTDE